MSNDISKEKQPLQIHIVDGTNTTDFEQLKTLKKKLMIDSYIRNDLKFFNLNREEQNKIINSAIEILDNPNLDSVDLTSDDIEKIQKAINEKIDFLKEDVTNPDYRYYVLKDEDRVVAFQEVYINEGEEKEKIEGHIAGSYTEPEYRTKGDVITISGERKEGSFSKILIEDAKKWFSEKGVTHEEIGAGENVFYNMETYIVKWGFIPDERINGTIFMVRDVNNPIEDKNVLSKIFELCVNNRKRTETKTFQDIEYEIESSEELKILQEEVKKRLVQIFLKDDEREKITSEQLGKETLEEQENTGEKKLTERYISNQIRELEDKQKEFD